MRKRLKSSQFNSKSTANFIKKTAIGSLIGVIALGTLPATIGTTFAAPEQVEAPLVIKGGWQPALEKIQMIQLDLNSNSSNPSMLQPERPMGLIARHAPVNPLNPQSEEGAAILSFSDYDMKSLYFGIEAQAQAVFGGGPVIYAEEPIAVNDIALGTFTQSESTPAAFGTGEGNNDLGPNVYRLFLPDLTSKYVQAKPLIEEGTIEDPQGIDMLDDTGETLYVAGGQDGRIWKLTKIYEIDSVNEPVDVIENDTDADQNSVSEDVYGNNEFSDGDIGLMDAGYEYSAEIFATFEQGSDLTDVVYDDGELYVADAGLNRVVKIDLDAPEQAQPVATGLNEPQAIALDGENNVYIADTGNNQVKKVNAANGQIEILAGTGEASQSYEGVPAVQSSLTEPKGIAVDQASGIVYVADVGRVQKLVDKFFYQQVRDENGEVWNLVENAEGLDRMRDDVWANYKLTNDISKTALEEYLIGKNESSDWTPIGDERGFTGKFDGGGHSIGGLKIRDQYGGLFTAVYKATVENVRLTDVDIENYMSTGGLAARAYSSDISKVSVEGTIRGSDFVGGLIGNLEDSRLAQSFFNGSVSGNGNVGGLIGQADFENGYESAPIHDNYVWGEVSQLVYTRLQSNTVTTANFRSDRFGGFVGNVYYEPSIEETDSSVIFKNNYASVKLDGTNGNLSWMETFAFGGSDETIPSVSNYWNTKSNSGKENELINAKALNDEEMKRQASFVDWDFQNIWSMDPVSGYPVFKGIKEEPTTPPVTPPTTPSTPSTGGGTSSPIVTSPIPASNTTVINVNVQNDKTANGSVVSTLAITRTKGTDGTIKDALQLTPAKATEIINLLKTSGSKTAAIVLPDTSDEVSQWDLTVPGAASKLLTDEGIELVILNPNVRITVAASSMTGLTEDLYFRLIPVKSTATSAEIQARALANQQIVTAANGGDITVVGRPMTIETNLQSRPVTLTLPLPANSSFTAAAQKKLGVYIEHSDGTKQLVPGKVVTQEGGKLGIEITVNHFSTFTIVNVSNWGSMLIASPYIMGYANGSFKPAQNITRAELAAIVGRITGVTEGTATFSDVKNGSWASTVVGPAAASGIMTGYGDGTFKPNASITRGELAAALSKLLPQSGLDASGQAAGFSDLAASHWAATAASQLQAAGVVTGYADGSFKPEQNVTRAEAVAMINRLIGLDGSTALPGAASWNDVADTYWAYDAVRAASMKR
ncbi:S-layer homology domain-containing protein [Saccharibacillus endophyticus]|uniref:SLH domain-containing protein n=1 Tax=Saccharibacillus endophyticus TaxID=2060666 RepID=A0ABQ1ZVQ4_9BACL|nr:S-layer homology domain-containing protein [Saccharibacillus endophyticus]GGH77864.1 hypothetical protein GCM10007362_22260 [Saccharibacillus endophyticus]